MFIILICFCFYGKHLWDLHYDSQYNQQTGIKGNILGFWVLVQVHFDLLWFKKEYHGIIDCYRGNIDEMFLEGVSSVSNLEPPQKGHQLRSVCSPLVT